MTEFDSGPSESAAPDRISPWPLVVAFLLAIAADQATKEWALAALDDCTAGPQNTFDLCLAYNQGMAFSLGRSAGPVIALVAVTIVVVLLVTARKVPDLRTRVLMGVVAGGALGNIVDRAFRAPSLGVDDGLLRGAVVDFLYTSFWPTFNVADTCVVVGGLLLAIVLWRTPVDDEPVAPAP